MANARFCLSFSLDIVLQLSKCCMVKIVGTEWFWQSSCLFEAGEQFSFLQGGKTTADCSHIFHLLFDAYFQQEDDLSALIGRTELMQGLTYCNCTSVKKMWNTTTGYARICEQLTVC